MDKFEKFQKDFLKKSYLLNENNINANPHFIICVFSLTTENNKKNIIASIASLPYLNQISVDNLFENTDLFKFLFYIDGSLNEDKDLNYYKFIDKYIANVSLQQFVQLLLNKQSEYKNIGYELYLKRSLFLF